MLYYVFIVSKILLYSNGLSYALSGNSTRSCLLSADKSIIDCSQKSFENVPFVLLDSNFPKMLNLSHNDVKEISANDFSTKSASLEILDLSYNKIRRLEGHTFSKLESLKVLNLSHNKIKRINGFTFANLNFLKVLNMERNAIPSLEDGSFHDLISLEILNLNRNKLSSVEAGWLFGLGNLLEFHANSNYISRLEKSAWSYTPNLKIIDLSKNNIRALVDESILRNLINLRTLLLNRNGLSRINKNVFRYLENLVILDLSHNSLFDAFTDNKSYLLLENTKSLEILKLNSNDLPTISNKTFANLINLKRLELLNNPIVSLPHGMLSNKHRLVLFADSDKFFCDCRSSWLLNALKTRSVDIIGGLECALPLKYRQRAFNRLDIADLACNQKLIDFKFNSKFADIIILEHDNLTFGCGADFECPVDDCEIFGRWLREDEILTERSDHHFIKNDLKINSFSTKLSFITVKNTSNGEYTCKFVSRKTGHLFSASGDLIVRSKPVFVKVPSNTTAIIGGTVRLDCQATGDPPPEVSWRKDDHDNGDVPAAVERRMHVMPSPDDDAFFISNVRAIDAGRYTCVAENSAGRTTAEAFVQILDSQAKFDENAVDVSSDLQKNEQHSSSSLTSNEARNLDVENSIRNVILNEKQSIVLECPQPTNFSSPKDSSYEWRFNGRNLLINTDNDSTGNNFKNQKYHTTSNGRILVALAALKSDSGLYTCKLSGEESNSNVSFMLLVKNENDGPSEVGVENDHQTPPGIFYVIDARRDVYLSLNEKLAIICSIAAASICVLLVIILSFYVKIRRRNERRVNVVLAVKNYSNNDRTAKSSLDFASSRPLRSGDNSEDCASSET